MNVGLPGEHVVIIPPGAAVPPPADTQPRAPKAKPLIEQWLDLFFGE